MMRRDRIRCYKEVKNRITKSLIAGEWTPGDALPSESRLAARFSVSVGTIRRSVDELVAEKIVVRQQGRGTYVTTHTEDRQFYYFFHMVGKDGGKEPPVHELLSLQTTRADSEAMAQFGLKPGDRVHRIHNVLKLGGAPVIFDELRIAAAQFADLDADAFGAREGTIYGLYQSRYGINVVRISERLSAALPAGAHRARARRERVEPGARHQARRLYLSRATRRTAHELGQYAAP